MLKFFLWIESYLSVVILDTTWGSCRASKGLEGWQENEHTDVLLYMLPGCRAGQIVVESPKYVCYVMLSLQRQTSLTGENCLMCGHLQVQEKGKSWTKTWVAVTKAEPLVLYLQSNGQVRT